MLDEPFSALDAASETACKELLIQCFERDGFTVLMVSHDMTDLRGLCETIVHVDTGVVEKRQ
jgi:sulfonate transport system ATP-binding protein